MIYQYKHQPRDMKNCKFKVVSVEAVTLNNDNMQQLRLFNQTIRYHFLFNCQRSVELPQAFGASYLWEAFLMQCLIILVWFINTCTVKILDGFKITISQSVCGERQMAIILNVRYQFLRSHFAPNDLIGGVKIIIQATQR